jgi:integrase
MNLVMNRPNCMYIMKQGKYYYAVLEVPKDVRKILGKTSFRKTLKTTNEFEAQKRATPLIEEWKILIAEARKPPLEQLEGKLEDIRQDIISIKKQIEISDDADVFDELQNQMFCIEGVAEDLFLSANEVSATDELNPSQVIELRQVFNAIHSTSFTSNLEIYLADAAVESKTKDLKRHQILRFAKRTPNLEDISREAVRSHIGFLSKEENLSNNSIKRDLTNLAVYWDYLRDNLGIIKESETNPFRGHKLPPENRKEAMKKKRLPFSQEDIQRIHETLMDKADSGNTANKDLLDMFLIAIYTGARLEEIGRIKIKNIFADTDNKQSFRIEDAKTEAGNRSVPIHPQLLPTIQNRLNENSSDNEYLFPDLSLSKYGKRTDAIGKRFGRIKKSLGYDSRFNFHCLRHTVVTLLEQAGVPESISADIVGHEKTNLTYGLYSGGTSIEQKREAIGKLNYKSKKAGD